MNKGHGLGTPDSRYYDDTYTNSDAALNAAIRRDAFGEDIGQFSWLTAAEHRRFFSWLNLAASSDVLEIASGSGGPALHLVESMGCRLTGIDLHGDAVAAANEAAAQRRLAERARFYCGDAREPLEFDEKSFDAVMCIDSINHLYERASAFTECLRLLRPGGSLLFTDPIVITGMVRREEMITRSAAMGDFVFTPPGLNDALLIEAGFTDIERHDVTENMTQVAESWHASRKRHRTDLLRVEGTSDYANFQQFLEVVESLARERRLSRFAYLAKRPISSEVEAAR